MTLKTASGEEAMFSPWQSFEEYSEWVRPSSVTKTLFWSKTRRCLLHRITDLRENADEIDDGIKDLRALRYDGEVGRPEATDAESDCAPTSTRNICLQICHCGEELLMYAKGLTMTYEIDDFLHEKDLFENWERYDGSDRIHQELNKFFAAAVQLSATYRNIVDNSDDFLLQELDHSLPRELERDFIMARDQFSVGLEELGFFSAGRGLEGVLRAVAKKKAITIESRGASTPAAEADLYDLIECIARTRWKSDKTPLIDTRTKTLLHHIRTARNATAHPGGIPVDENWRALAILVASHASRLWKLAERRYAGLVEKKIARVW